MTEQDAGAARADYASAFEVATDGATRRTAEQWARSAFEDSPRALRMFIVAGWRGVLGLRLGPASSPAYVLGWGIVSTTPEAITLEVRSPLLTARKVLRVQESRVVAITCVPYEHRAARAVWAAVAPVHHRTEPYLLGRAATRLSSSLPDERRPERGVRQRRG